MRNSLRLMGMLLLAAVVALAGCAGPKAGAGGPGPGVDESQLSPNPDPGPEQSYPVTFYYSDKDLMKQVAVVEEVKAPNEQELPRLALIRWLQGPDRDDLVGLAPPEVTVEYLQDVDGVAHVSFSKEIQNANLGSTGEMMLLEQLALLMQQFGFTATQVLVEGKIVESLLGHVYTQEPIRVELPPGGA